MATKDYSSKQEKMVADVLGWEVVAGSGAAACYPGDVISDEWLGECKTHVEPGHKIFFSKDVWEKIKTEATVKHRFPVLFADDGTQKYKNTWCICLCDRLETEDILFIPIVKGVNKNISFNHGEQSNNVAQILGDNPGKHIVLTATWHGEKIAICQLSVFASIVRE